MDRGRPDPRPGRRPYRSRTFLSDALAWLLLLVLAGAGAVKWREWAHRPALEPPDAAGGVPDARIVVLAYDRVVAEPDGRHVDRASFRRHLEALRRDGFRPVTLSALARFYRGEGGLPARSALLTFDHAYLSTFDAVDPVLREHGWPAVMFVMTERVERRDPFFLYWPRLERMVDSRVWEIGTHGHRGHAPVRVDAEGNEGPFFLRRAWLGEAGREEEWGEFAARVNRDHAGARSLLETRLGTRVLAYAPPLKDVAVASLDPEVYRVHEDALRARYALAFIEDLFGVNDRFADPHHLRRLRVGPWSAGELAGRLEKALGEVPAPGEDDEVRLRLWRPGAGAAEVQGDELRATGPARADLWRAGSQWAEDWSLDAEVWIGSGQLWLVQQSPDLAEEWRFGGDARRSHLQRRRPARTVETLATFPTAIEPGGWHRLRVLRRGAGVWVEWDGEPVSERPAWLPERWHGHVGLVAWGDGPPARLALRKVRFSAIPHHVRPLGGWPSTEEVQAAIRDAPSLAALSPEWLECTGGGIEERPFDRDLLTILSRRYGWQIVPTVRVHPGGERVLAPRLPELLARAGREGFPGLRLDLVGLGDDGRQEIEEAVERSRRSGGPSLLLVVDTRPSPSLDTPRVADGGEGAGLDGGVR